MTDKVRQKTLEADLQLYNNLSVACVTASALTPSAALAVYACVGNYPQITSFSLVALGACVIWCMALHVIFMTNFMTKRDDIIAKLEN